MRQQIDTAPYPSTTQANAAPFPVMALPPSDASREVLHNEVHARPPARIRLPALVVYVAVLNDGVSREQECAHLRQLADQSELPLEALSTSFLRLRFDNHTLKWERHTEFSRYTLVQSLPDGALTDRDEAALLQSLVIPPQWWASIPGKTVAAIMVAMVHGDVDDPAAMRQTAEPWLDSREPLASLLASPGSRRMVVSSACTTAGSSRPISSASWRAASFAFSSSATGSVKESCTRPSFIVSP